jgi:hypothetical protein
VLDARQPIGDSLRDRQQLRGKIEHTLHRKIVASTLRGFRRGVKPFPNHTLSAEPHPHLA